MFSGLFLMGLSSTHLRQHKCVGFYCENIISAELFVYFLCKIRESELGMALAVIDIWGATDNVATLGNLAIFPLYLSFFNWYFVKYGEID